MKEKNRSKPSKPEIFSKTRNSINHENWFNQKTYFLTNLILNDKIRKYINKKTCKSKKDGNKKNVDKMWKKKTKGGFYLRKNDPR